MIWNEKMECASRDEIEAIQLERLKSTVARCYNNVEHYRNKLDAAGVHPDDIKTLDDIRKIPFTVKDDLRDNYPYKLFAVPMKDVVRVHASSGTTGKPTVVGYTKADLDMWSEVVARMACAAGATSDDIAQIAFGYTLFTGAFGLHYGLEKLGATIIPISGGNTERQLNVMQDFGTTLLVSTPSYALYLAEVAKKKGIDTKKLPLKIGMFGGEGHTEEMRREIENAWDMVATENYGLSEIIGPGTSGECIYKNGMHIAEDHFYCEIVDPDTLEPVPIGQPGELVITPLSKEALPILRYRTKDITWLIPEKCECGRTSMRMAKIQGRTDDMLIIRGVNVFPSQIESVLLEIEGVEPHYQIMVDRDGALDMLEIDVEVNETVFSDEIKNLQNLEKRIEHDIKDILGVSATVRLVEPKTTKRSEGKAVRVIDKRKI